MNLKNRAPYELEVDKESLQKDMEEKINSVRKEFEDKIKDKETKYQTEISKERSEKTNLQKMLEDIKSKQKESSVFCPTCSDNEHKHSMKEIEPGVFECVGEDCKSKKIFVDPESDYMCVDCGSAHKKPKSPDMAKKIDCPFCHGTKMVKYDWKTKFDRIKKAKGRK